MGFFYSSVLRRNSASEDGLQIHTLHDVLRAFGQRPKRAEGHDRPNRRRCKSEPGRRLLLRSRRHRRLLLLREFEVGRTYTSLASTNGKFQANSRSGPTRGSCKLTKTGDLEGGLHDVHISETDP